MDGSLKIYAGVSKDVIVIKNYPCSMLPEAHGSDFNTLSINNILIEGSIISFALLLVVNPDFTHGMAKYRCRLFTSLEDSFSLLRRC